jgi:PhzF family phenazine biosynthesis protein
MGARRIREIHAFCRAEPFTGNPAAVIEDDPAWSDQTRLLIARANQLSETAFYRFRSDGDVDLRWFTPGYEVDLCGHATLATAFALFCDDPSLSMLQCHTRSGMLSCERRGEGIAMCFPTVGLERETRADDPLRLILGEAPVAVHDVKAIHGGRFLLAELDNEAGVRAAKPDMSALAAADAKLLVTAKGQSVDVVSRFFAPSAGIPEDPATGSAHCVLSAYWSRRLGKTTMTAHQLSPQGGALTVSHLGEVTELVGIARLFLDGQVWV